MIILCPSQFSPRFTLFFFFNDTSTTEIYTLSLHDALPICSACPPDPSARRAASTSAAPDPGRIRVRYSVSTSSSVASCHNADSAGRSQIALTPSAGSSSASATDCTCCLVSSPRRVTGLPSGPTQAASRCRRRSSPAPSVATAAASSAGGSATAGYSRCAHPAHPQSPSSGQTRLLSAGTPGVSSATWFSRMSSAPVAYPGLRSINSPSTLRRPAGSRAVNAAAHASTAVSSLSSTPSAAIAVKILFASQYRELSAIAAGYRSARRSSSRNRVGTLVLAGCSLSVSSKNRRYCRTSSTPCPARSHRSTWRGTT